uniref:Uncharacterized protein n=1 Tax=Acinetobacter phage vB_Ab_1137_KEN_05 TaxID=3143020 RepID=A0AAU8KWL7_9VIRU
MNRLSDKNIDKDSLRRVPKSTCTVQGIGGKAAGLGGRRCCHTSMEVVL